MRRKTRAVHEAEDKTPLRDQTIYVAAPNYHLLIERNRSLSLSIDEPVHHSRPAIDVLFESAAITRDDVVLEVGTGTGALTALLAQHAAAVVTVEIDPKMFLLASEELHRFDNVVMLQVDALKNKNRLNPVVLEAVAAQLASAPGRRRPGGNRKSPRRPSGRRRREVPSYF